MYQIIYPCINLMFVSYSRYIPPLIWGKSGHLQTALYGKLGRVSSPHPFGLRKYLPMQDGATATFDLFEPPADHQSGGQCHVVGFIWSVLERNTTLLCGNLKTERLSGSRRKYHLNVMQSWPNG